MQSSSKPSEAAPLDISELRRTTFKGHQDARQTCPGGTILTFMARNERYTYDEDGRMRLQDLMEVAE
jgi:hypothetical protein